MEQELPKIDITEDFVIGSNADIDLNILNLYTHDIRVDLRLKYLYCA